MFGTFGILGILGINHIPNGYNGIFGNEYLVGGLEHLESWELWIKKIFRMDIMGYLAMNFIGGLEPWNFMKFHILGMSSSQLTFIFFRGVETTNQYISMIKTRHDMVVSHVFLFCYIYIYIWWIGKKHMFEVSHGHCHYDHHVQDGILGQSQ